MSDSKQRASINLNDYIYVQLTSLGLALYRHCRPEHPTPEPDAEGLYRFQLFEFAEIFGRRLRDQFSTAVLESMNAELETRGVPGNTVEVLESDTPPAQPPLTPEQAGGHANAVFAQMFPDLAPLIEAQAKDIREAEEQSRKRSDALLAESAARRADMRKRWGRK